MTAESRANFVLIVCILIGPLALLTNLLACFALAPWACGNGWVWPLRGTAFGFLAVVLTALTLSWAYWQRAGVIWPDESASNPSRVRFMAVVGLFINLISALQIVGVIVYSFILGACQ
jgi:hypothetical protein